MVAQAFDCTPLQAYRQPMTLVREVLEARAFRQAYEEIDAWDKREQNQQPRPPQGPMADRVNECLREKAQRVIGERRARGL